MEILSSSGSEDDISKRTKEALVMEKKVQGETQK
jgi:hypothetical protein